MQRVTFYSGRPSRELAECWLPGLSWADEEEEEEEGKEEEEEAGKLFNSQ